MYSIFNASAVPACIDQAIIFLTRPLSGSKPPSVVFDVQNILQSTLRTCFNARVRSELTLTLSADALPPNPILKACLVETFSGKFWDEWMKLLGGRTFDLIIATQTIKVIYHGANPKIEIVWSGWSGLIRAPTRRAVLFHTTYDHDEPQVPVSKVGQSALRAVLDSAVARNQARTVAQKLLESKRDEEECDEILAMISTCAITTPSPMSDKFTVDPPAVIVSIASSFPSPLSSPEVECSPLSSRPGSRSSTFSTFSSDDESNTSVSSTSSLDFVTFTKPSSTVFVDNIKKEAIKYVYKGGVSTVLSGGVMLGGSFAAAPAKASHLPKYRAPVGGKKFSPAQNAASANTWRRAPRV